ncbi:MAG: hypothetical protein BWX86_02263 [Verrucomicrobia bacterium ADurb.Bin122]|nr:MAG: hypothetical protein BWX86_02263 [Verrucomicrobia bacterium ADurb.Bin122]
MVTSRAGTPTRRNTPGSAPNGVTAAKTSTVNKHTPPRTATVSQPGPVGPCQSDATAAHATKGDSHSSRNPSGRSASRAEITTTSSSATTPTCHGHQASGMSAVPVTSASIAASFHSGASHASGTRTAAVGRNSGAYGV